MFEDDGAECNAKALSSFELSYLQELADRHSTAGPGVRLANDKTVSSLLRPDGTLERLARSKLGDGARPVRAILFDKSPDTNWALGWHQDRTIALRARIETPDFGPWTKKAGIVHVEPPFEIIENMITLRAHLDDCGNLNAPLKIILGSHRLGRIPIEQVTDTVKQGDQFMCLAEAGDVWVYATAILHASNAAVQPTHRRVLQVDYSRDPLPNGLDWFGV